MSHDNQPKENMTDKTDKTTIKLADRKALHAYVTSAAHDSWHEFGADEGVSVSALLEELAEVLEWYGTPERDAVPVGEMLNAIVKAGRRLDAGRRRSHRK